MIVKFIVPYFGKLPNTFTLWLKCCKYNSDFQWLVFTDDLTPYVYPENVIVEYLSLEELKQRFEKNLQTTISLEKSYKLCDFRPLFGELFSEELKDATHWGYCDTDLLFGKLSNFITDKMLNDYDKISVLGHLCIIKNSTAANSCFRKCDYLKIIQNPKNCIFDEVRYEPNINSLFIENKLKIKETIPYADIGHIHFRFQSGRYSGGKRGKIDMDLPMIFQYKKGRTYQYILKNHRIIRYEVVYIHFQKREIDVKISQNTDDFILIPNQIVNDTIITEEYILNASKDHILYTLKKRYERLKRAMSRIIIK